MSSSSIVSYATQERYYVVMNKIEALHALDATTEQFHKTRRAHGISRTKVTVSVLAALRAGARPTDVEVHSPFTISYIRKIARRNGIPAQPRGQATGNP
jgi:hypothetical protein